MESPAFSWDEIRRSRDGRIVLLYRHERIFAEPFMPQTVDVLDVGGWGVLARRLLEANKRCTILDLFTADQLYPERVRALPHRKGDVCDSRVFAPTSFDLVTCFETLEHVHNAGLALRNIATWLRPQGWLVGTVPVPGYCHGAGEPGITILSEAQLTVQLQAAGFVEIYTAPSKSIGLPDEPACCIYFRAMKPGL